MKDCTITIESQIGHSPRGDGDYHVRTKIQSDKNVYQTVITQERPYGTGDNNMEYGVFSIDHECSNLSNECEKIAYVLSEHGKIHTEWEDFAKKERMKNSYGH